MSAKPSEAAIPYTGPSDDITCTDCNTTTRPGEYHPYAFCVLAKAGLDPWREIRLIAAQIGLGDPGAQPPLVSEVHHAE